MTVRFKNAFFKDIERLPADIRPKVEQLVFVAIPSSHRITELANVRKLKGYSRFYRIRIGDFRVGFELREEVVVVHRILRRNDIYRYFP